MNAFSLRARVIVPVDGPPIDNGVVTIDNGRIVAVDRGSSATSGALDLGDVALLPGLVNAHTHLEFSHLALPLGAAGGPLPEWIEAVLHERRRRSFHPASAIIEGCRESLGRGVTTIGEIATVDATTYRDIEPRPDLVLFHEAIGFSRARAESVATAIEEKLAAAERGVAGIQFGISPHAPYTVSPALVERLINIARARRLAMAMHLAESREELELLADGSGPFRDLLESRSMWDDQAIPHGTRPHDYLQALSLAPRALVVHGNYLSDDETALLAQHRSTMSLVHCPRTCSYFGHPPLPLTRLLEQKVRIVLGTDSRASNPDLCLLSEMRHVARQHPQMPPAAILEMGTHAAAEALGLDRTVGSITPGKLANLTAVPCPGCTSSNASETILHADWPTSGTWLRGERVA